MSDAPRWWKDERPRRGRRFVIYQPFKRRHRMRSRRQLRERVGRNFATGSTLTLYGLP